MELRELRHFLRAARAGGVSRIDYAGLTM